MRKFNAILVDDEINLQETLEILIHRNCPEIEIVGKAKSAEEARELIKQKSVDLIFLDISMPKETGFDFLASIPKENYVVIFTTAYEEYALKAIKANAIDYLLKPIDPLELKQAVLKATALIALKSQKKGADETYNESLNNLTQQIKSGQTHFSKITIVEKFGYRIVELKSIRYLEADSNYTIIHLSSLDKIVSSKSLGEYEKILDPDLFFRIHKSTIINLNYLSGFSSYQGYFAILDDNTKLSISRRRFNEFKDIVGLLSKSVD
ncbi:LytTR family DNA-binding domain-containing protein [uncultured Draconibacterium sp.]|uniref:LytR/AlgR family response regulator transcription factor n=1 Tax=uncultured Draconibacterium sp. TaxID=1573823 RepID=UPI003217CF9A